MGGRGTGGGRGLNLGSRDKNVSRLFQIVETGKDIRSSSILSMTEKEMSAYVKARQENMGYVPGLGGDKTYAITAWLVGDDGHGYVDMEDIWRRYGKRRKK